jgi:hypothetical protein
MLSFGTNSLLEDHFMSPSFDAQSPDIPPQEAQSVADALAKRVAALRHISSSVLLATQMLRKAANASKTDFESNACLARRVLSLGRRVCGESAQAETSFVQAQLHQVRRLVGELETELLRHKGSP